MGQNLDKSKGIEFDKVLLEERREVSRRRKVSFFSPGGGDRPPGGLVGLALSGGGVRSATFCLGLMQGLHDLKLLRIFDYISTVSGGGYLGGWWSAWLARDEGGMRARRESPVFSLDSIKNPASLAVRVRDGGDEVSARLRRQLAGNLKNYALLAKYKEGEEPGRELVQALVDELNAYLQRTPEGPDSLLVWQPDESTREFEGLICIRGLRAAPARRRFYSVRSDAAWDDEHKARGRLHMMLNGHYLWANRIELENAYPYELKDIFPPAERIEPERKYDAGPGGQVAEGSLCAWDDPAHHLRLFASYLTPRRGALSADTWRAVSVVTRNLVLTWLILLPFLMAVTLVGQLYFLIFLGQEVREKFLKDGDVGIGNILLVPAGFLGWIVVMAVVWLLWGRETSAATETVVQWVGIFVVGLLLWAVAAVARLPKSLCDALNEQPAGRWLLAAWVAVLAALLVYALRAPAETKEIKGDPETVTRWKREVRRNRLNRIQTRLVVLMVVSLVVLLLSGYSYYLTDRLWAPDGKQSTSSSWLRIPISLIPIISAVAGSIFTALKATPSGGGEKAASREPSFVSRAIFAVTPPLVVVVLTVTMTSASHRLVMTLAGIKDGESMYAPVTFLLVVAGIFGVALCLALAVYEMRDLNWADMMTPSPALLFFLCLLTVNVSWGAQALLQAKLGSTEAPSGWLMFVAILFTVVTVSTVIFVRVIVRRQHIRHLLFKRARAKYKEAQLKGERGRAFPEDARGRKHALPLLRDLYLSLLAGTAFYLLVAAGCVIMFFGGGADPVVKWWGLVIPLWLALLSGSAILFRQLIVRSDQTGPWRFELRWFKGAVARRPATIWLVAAACFVLPVAVICWLDAASHGWRALWTRETPGAASVAGALASLRQLDHGILASWLLPAAFAGLMVSLIYFRLRVIRAVATNQFVAARDPGRLSGRFLEAVTAGGHRQGGLQLLAAVAIVGVIIFQRVMLTGDPPTHSMGLWVSWPCVVFVLLVFFPLFGFSIIQLPVPGPAAQRYAADPAGKERRMRAEAVLWALAFCCILLAVFCGHFLFDWVGHLAHPRYEHSYAAGLSSVALPVMVGCLTLLVMEAIWGISDNQRSIWLLLFAYLGCLTFFAMDTQMLDRVVGDTAVRPLQVVLGLLAAALVWIAALGWMVDPNMVSMHQFYKSRLVRAYLGASNIMRLRLGDKDITDSVAGDDVPLKDLRNCERGAPYHLIGVTLNLVAGHDLSTTLRSASSFTLARLHCGSQRTRFRPTASYMKGHLSLGTAIATSGAAVSPSMGTKKPTSALAMLMTLLNVRLGYWAPTPNRKTWNLPQPRLWPFYLLREFLSQTNDLSSYCYLTDGGHFDNTGLYPLVERGCRFIVVADCAADPKQSFQDIGEAIRRCRIDFGAEINLCLDPLINAPADGKAKCFVVGEITYSSGHLRSLGGVEQATGGDSHKGVIVYIKPAVIDEVSADVRQYKIENHLFPQQSTANQWFDEAQFESYRRLGELCAKNIFSGLEEVKKFSTVVRYSDVVVENIFRRLFNRDGDRRLERPTYW